VLIILLSKIHGAEKNGNWFFQAILDWKLLMEASVPYRERTRDNPSQHLQDWEIA